MEDEGTSVAPPRHSAPIISSADAVPALVISADAVPTPVISAEAVPAPVTVRDKTFQMIFEVELFFE